MTKAQFLAWDDHAGARYEFDGEEPVPMTGGTINHSGIAQNLYAALRGRLRGDPCRAHGPDAGMGADGRAVRYPDALVTCSGSAGTALLVDSPLVIFEIVSAHSSRTDRTVLERNGSGDGWRAGTLMGVEEMLRLPSIGIEIRVSALYADIDFGAVPEGGSFPG